MRQVHLFISGFVQGVGFRRFIRHHARKIGVVGWVTNLQDGRVEAVIQGEEKVLHKMIKRASSGPFFSRVENVGVEWEDVEEKFEEFVIRK